MSSIIHKFFHKKSSGSSSLSNQEPDLEKSQGFVKEPNTIVEKEPIKRMPNNANLDLPQLIVGVAHSVGIERDHNEDALYTLTTYIVSDDKTVHFGLYIIADGRILERANTRDGKKIRSGA